MNVLHYQITGARNDEGLRAVGNEWLRKWRDTLRFSVPAAVVLQRLEITDLSANGAASVELGGAAGDSGQLGGVAMPSSVALVISLRTAFRGRSYRGRIYHIGLTETDVDGNQVLNARRVDLEAGYNALKTLQPAGGAASGTLGVLSYYANKAVRGVPLFTPVTTLSIDSYVDTQRRRLPGR